MSRGLSNEPKASSPAQGQARSSPAALSVSCSQLGHQPLFGFLAG